MGYLSGVDAYTTIAEESIAEYKEKGSRFIGYARQVSSRDDFQVFMEEVKKEHHKARHHCWAYSIGIDELEERSSDDGEPSGSAGRPILNQIKSFELHQIAVIVVRYFGGTKLGVPGLIRSYKLATKEALTQATKQVKQVLEVYKIDFDYTIMAEVMQVLKYQDVIEIEKTLDASPYVTFGLPPSASDSITGQILKILHKVPEDYQGELTTETTNFKMSSLEKR